MGWYQRRVHGARARLTCSPAQTWWQFQSLARPPGSESCSAPERECLFLERCYSMIVFLTSPVHIRYCITSTIHAPFRMRGWCFASANIPASLSATHIAIRPLDPQGTLSHRVFARKRLFLVRCSDGTAWSAIG